MFSSFHHRTGNFICLFIFIVVAVLLSSSVKASTYISAGDEAYVLLSRLEAEGVITDALLSTKPLSRGEVVRLALVAEGNAAGRSPFIKGLVEELKRRVRAEEYQAKVFRPVESVAVTYHYTNAPVLALSYPGTAPQKEQAFNYNNDGDLFDRGSNFRMELVSRVDDHGRLSVYLEPQLRSSGDLDQVILKKGYGVLGFSWIDIVAGRDSQWWGPGYHGAIILSNNAEPLTLLKLTGPGPQVLPWIFKYLGPLQYDLFVTKLEKDRSDFPEPYLWGLRFDFKPHPNIEIGFERTAILGGEGRPTNASTWLHSIMGSNEHDASGNPGDQRAGGDVKVTLPFKLQPVQLYMEWAGEENRQEKIPWPYKIANLYGLYLPRLLDLERISLRVEYALDDVKKQPDVWYTHGTYTAGYTYKGMVMGHHMGTQSRDLFLELSYLTPENGARISFSFDRIKHDQGGPAGEIMTEVMIYGRSMITTRVEVMASCGYAMIENPGKTSGPTQSVKEFSTTVKYLF